LAVVHSNRGSPEVLTSWTSPISLPNTTGSFGLNSSPYRCNLCSQIFMQFSDRIRGWRKLFELSSQFSLNNYYRFRQIKLQQAKRFFPVESPSYVCAVL
jgi:hypothetical protein